MSQERATSYFCTERVRAEIEQDLGTIVAEQTSDDFGMILLASPDINGYFGTIGRSLEIARGFNEMPEDMDGLEHASRFIYAFDQIEGAFRVTHSMRYLEPSRENPLEVVGSLLGELEGQVTLEEAVAYHDIDTPDACLYVTTDLSVPGILPTRTKPYGLLTYKTLFEHAKAGEFSHVIAYMNPSTIRCMDRLGLKPALLCGRGDYRIPPVGGQTFEEYQPYVLSPNLPEARVFDDVERAKQTSLWSRKIIEMSPPIFSIEER